MNELRNMSIGSAECCAKQSVVERTVGENIDAKINGLKEAIVRLEESKKTLSPLLEMRISDLRDAMSY